MDKSLLKELAKTGHLTVTITGPAASGKDLLASQIVQEFQGIQKVSVSVTSLETSTTLLIKNWKNGHDC